jgi:hypothetical protein
VARSNHIINSLIAGEASEKFLGRTDAQQYNQSCEDTFNWMIYPQGGGGRRPGTIHVENLSTCNALTGTETMVAGCVVPFTASNGRRYQLGVHAHLRHVDLEVPHARSRVQRREHDRHHGRLQRCAGDDEDERRRHGLLRDGLPIFRKFPIRAER